MAVSSEEGAGSQSRRTGETTVVSRAEDAKIVFRRCGRPGETLPLLGGRITLGRSPKNDIVVKGFGDVVSAFHALLILRPEDRSWWIEDLDSTNGTFINGERVQRARLCESDLVRFAPAGPELEFTTRLVSPAGIVESAVSAFGRLLAPGVRLGGASRTKRIRLAAVSLTLVLACGAASLRLFAHREVAASDGPPAVAIEIRPEVDPIYGSLFLSYRSVPIGRVEVRNCGSRPLSGLEVSFEFLKGAEGFLVVPYEARIAELPVRETRTVPLLPRLSTEVLCRRTREVSALVRIAQGEKVLAERRVGVFIHGDNVFSWERPEGVAAFIDPQDPAVVEFIDAVWLHRPAAVEAEFPPPAVQAAAGIFTALAELGIEYLPDALTPVSARIDWRASDRVKYPWETLVSRTGDCDDLSVLYAAALEAASIPAAVAVGPEHVFLLFDAGIDEALLDSAPLDAETVVVHGGRVWLPIEPTVLGRPGASFNAAWAAAWRHRQAIADGGIAIVDVREAWKTYHPMNPVPCERITERIERIAWVRDGLVRAIEGSLDALRGILKDNLRQKVAEIEAQDLPASLRGRSLGVLYARSGLLVAAREAFEWSLFGVSLLEGGDIPTTPAELRAALARTPPEGDAAGLLFDLGVSIALGAPKSEDLILAASCLESAIERMPEGDTAPERGEALLRLALVHRIRGDLAGERRWCESAFREDPSMREVYRRLSTQDGRRSGWNDAVRGFILKGVR